MKHSLLKSKTDALIVIIRDQFTGVFLVPSTGPSGSFSIILFSLASRVMRVANRRAWLADFWHGDRKWFTVGDASRGEAERGDTRSGDGEVVCGGGMLDSLQSHSLSPPLSLSLVEPLRSSLLIIYALFSLSLSLSISLSAPREPLENSVKVSSPRRVVSLWEFEGRVVSLFNPLPLPLSLSRCSCASIVFRVLSWRRSQRNQTRNARSDFENARSFWNGRTFWIAHPHRPFSTSYLVSSFLSFSADLPGDRPPRYVLTLRLTKSWKRAFRFSVLRSYYERIVTLHTILRNSHGF